MKLKLILFICITFTLTYANAQKSANTILKTAYSNAEKENKNVIVIFHASWCGWCKTMDKKIMSADCKNLFKDNYVIEHLVVNESKKNKHLENPGAMDVLKKYGGEKSGIPFWLIFNSKGKLLENSFNPEGQNLGCPATKEEVALFIKKLKNTSSLTTKDLAIISKTFQSKK